MKIAIPKECYEGERRVAATPETAKRLMKLGFEVSIQSQAGILASCSDQAYQAVGVTIVNDHQELWQNADIILKVRAPIDEEVDLLSSGQTIISFMSPYQNKSLIEKINATGATSFGIDAVPRITRAQKLDALSSMANIAGYRAVIEAAHSFGRFFTGQMTAAGKAPPAKVLVIGAGVAGLSAIGVARGLGAIVRAFDTRPAVKDQVTSMGAEFLELNFEEDGTGSGGYAKVMSDEFIKAEMELFTAQAKDVDMIITTALIPGHEAPKLIKKEMVESMKPGSVVVDLAAEQGGNCELTQKDQRVTHQGVSIIGYTDLPSRMAPVASQLYGSNLYHFLDDLGGSESFNIDLEDEVIRGSILCHQNEILWPAPKKETPAPTAQPTPAPKPSVPEASVTQTTKKSWMTTFWLLLAGTLLMLVGYSGDNNFLSHFTVFILSCVIGWQVIWNVTPALHTPLMSVTNAISGIIILGGLLQISGDFGSPSFYLGALAIFIATINIAGGFLVTHRMLKMFKREDS